MKIVIAGGTGQVGRVLNRAFHREGTEVVTLSRSQRSGGAARIVQWDGRSIGDWAREIDGADAVINLRRSQRGLPLSSAKSRRDLAFAGGLHPPHR